MMGRDKEKITFDHFWKEAIYPAVKRCLKELEPVDKDSLSFRFVNESLYKKKLSRIYYRKREWLKRIYLPNKGDQAVLDFHKLGAILCRSIIADKPFRFNVSRAQKRMAEVKKKYGESDPRTIQWEVDHVYINYKLAFLVSEGVAYLDLLYWTAKKMEALSKQIKTLIEEKEIEEAERKKAFYEQFKNELLNIHSLSAYKKSPDHDDFKTSMIVALMKHDLLMRKFDYLTYAATLYQWQEHTKQIIVSQIIFSKCSEYIPQYLQDEYDDMFVSKKEIK